MHLITANYTQVSYSSKKKLECAACTVQTSTLSGKDGRIWRSYRDV